MRTVQQIRERAGEKFRFLDAGADGFAAEWRVFGTQPMTLIVSWGENWEHASASFAHRTPTWGEMCDVKNLCWQEEEAVMQLHPPEDQWVNCHPYCLHLWRPKGQAIPLPPPALVGGGPTVGQTKAREALVKRARQIWQEAKARGAELTTEECLRRAAQEKPPC